jgi:hypothetical protein
MYLAELEVITSALTEERDNRARFGMDTSTLDAVLARASAVAELDEDTLAKLVEGTQALVAGVEGDLRAQLAALESLI